MQDSRNESMLKVTLDKGRLLYMEDGRPCTLLQSARVETPKKTFRKWLDLDFSHHSSEK